MFRWRYYRQYRLLFGQNQINFHTPLHVRISFPLPSQRSLQNMRYVRCTNKYVRISKEEDEKKKKHFQYFSIQSHNSIWISLHHSNYLLLRQRGPKQTKMYNKIKFKRQIIFLYSCTCRKCISNYPFFFFFSSTTLKTELNSLFEEEYIRYDTIRCDTTQWFQISKVFRHYFTHQSPPPPYFFTVWCLLIRIRYTRRIDVYKSTSNEHRQTKRLAISIEIRVEFNFMHAHTEITSHPRMKNEKNT